MYVIIENTSYFVFILFIYLYRGYTICRPQTACAVQQFGLKITFSTLVCRIVKSLRLTYTRKSGFISIYKGRALYKKKKKKKRDPKFNSYCTRRPRLFYRTTTTSSSPAIKLFCIVYVRVDTRTYTREYVRARSAETLKTINTNL